MTPPTPDIKHLREVLANTAPAVQVMKDGIEQDYMLSAAGVIVLWDALADAIKTIEAAIASAIEALEADRQRPEVIELEDLDTFEGELLMAYAGGYTRSDNQHLLPVFQHGMRTAVNALAAAIAAEQAAQGGDDART